MIYAYASTLNARGRLSSQKTAIKTRYPRGTVMLGEVLSADTAGAPGPEMKKILDRIQPGDTFVATEVRRLAREKEDAWNIYVFLISSDIHTAFLSNPFLDSRIVKESYDTYSSLLATPISIKDFLEKDVFIRNLFDYQFDKFDIAVENRKAGRLASGLMKDPDEPFITKGTTYVTSRFDECKDFIVANSTYFDGDMNDKTLLSHLTIGRDTYYKYKKILLKERMKNSQEENVKDK